MSIDIVESRSTRPRHFTSLLSLKLHTSDGERWAEGTVYAPNNPRLVSVRGINVEAPLAGTMLIICNDDQPGVIGEVGTILGRQGVNIANFALGRNDTGAIDKNVNEMVLNEVKRTFNPEFINRIDEIIVFEALTDDDLRRIMALLVEQLNQNLADRRMKVILAPEVVDWIIDITCKDRSYGARPLRRAIQRYVEDPLSEELIRGNLHDGDIEVYLETGQLAYRPAGQLVGGRKLP